MVGTDTYYAHHKSAPPRPLSEKDFQKKQAQLFFHVCQFLRLRFSHPHHHWHPMKIVANHVLVTSKQHHNMVSRPFFNAESNGWTGGSVFPPSTDVSALYQRLHSAINQPRCRQCCRYIWRCFAYLFLLPSPSMVNVMIIFDFPPGLASITAFKKLSCYVSILEEANMFSTTSVRL